MWEIVELLGREDKRHRCSLMGDRFEKYRCGVSGVSSAIDVVVSRRASTDGLW